MDKISLPIYDLTGKTNGTVELDASVFGVKPNATLLHQAVVSYLANRRAPIAHTKDRSDVRGGGKKPWRQKGTGNARVGSSRSPLWRGGGVTFGPTSDRNFSVRMPQKMRQAALKAALSTKVAAENFIVLDSLTSLDGKTKSWVKAVAQLPKADQRKLVVSATKEDQADRSIRNVEGQKYVDCATLTTYDLMRFPVVVITQDAVQALTQKLSKTTAAPEAAPAPKKTRATKTA